MIERRILVARITQQVAELRKWAAELGIARPAQRGRHFIGVVRTIRQMLGGIAHVTDFEKAVAHLFLYAQIGLLRIRRPPILYPVTGREARQLPDGHGAEGIVERLDRNRWAALSE